jgi:chemotaxis protein CheD
MTRGAGDVMVRMGEMATTAGGEADLVSIGLGSCIGLALLDRGKHVAGLAHVMLPETPADGTRGQDGKFADRAVPALLAAVTRAGARRHRLEAVLVGGARMFAVGSSLDVGARNDDAVRAALKAERIAVAAAATRGATGRTIRVDVGDGVVLVREAGGRDAQLFPERTS